MPGGSCPSNKPSHHRARLLVAHEVALADVEPVMAQDGVGGRHVEIEVRHREMQQIVGPAQRLGAVADREGDLAVLGAGQRLGRDILKDLESLADPGLQVRETVEPPLRW